MKTIKGLVKSYYSSSNGTAGLFIKELGKIIFFNTTKCRKITGIDDYLSSYLSNTVRVFTPAEISYGTDWVEIYLTAEGVTFVCPRVPKPKSMIEYIEVDEVLE